MIEQYLQVALEFVKEIWFQLDSKFGLEETEAFEFIQPYLLQLQDNPTYMGIAFAVLFLVPFGLYKVRSIARERERKLDELMEEMEEEDDEEYDEDDPRRQRRPELAKEENAVATEDDFEIDEDGDKPLFEKNDEDPPPYMQILEKLDEEEHEDKLHVDTKKVMGDDEFELEPISSELAEPDTNKDLSEFEEFEFDSNTTESDTTETEDSSHDQAIQELQKEGELIELDGELSADDPFAHYSDLDDEEQDRAIQELQDEMESTINKLTEQLESTPETTSSIKDLGDIRIGDGATIDDEYILEEEIEEPASLELSEPETLSLESLDFTEEVEPALESIEPVEVEPALETIEPVIEESPPLQPIPERDYSLEGSPSGEGDSLINRLKYFQENLDSRFHHGEKRELNPLPASKPKDLAGEHRFVEQRSFPTKTPSVPVDKKNTWKRWSRLYF